MHQNKSARAPVCSQNSHIQHFCSLNLSLCELYYCLLKLTQRLCWATNYFCN